MRLIIYLHIGLLLLSYIIDTVATETENKVTDRDVKQAGCTCVKYKCRCCEYLNWKPVHLNGLMCVKVRYIAEDIGVSISADYNSTVIIEENISVRRLFPLCVERIFAKPMPVVVCIQMFDIIISFEKIHTCFQIEGSFYKFKLPTVKLGCINMINSQNNTKGNQIKRFFFNAINDLNYWKHDNQSSIQ